MQRKLRVEKVRSHIGRPKKHKLTLLALGLRKIGDVAILPNRPEIRGMIEQVKHLVRVEEVEEETGD